MSALFRIQRSGIRNSGSAVCARRSTRTLSNFTKVIESNANKFHVYVSGIRDPYLNLSIEHYIYEKSAPGSTILLLYVNDPCIVIGRNQNPWLEANLKIISQNNIPLIRRRSGGGTVFHDHGNVNFSVTYPPSDFTRDKYAELVTRALRPYQPRARVNKRHDIVLDQGRRLNEESQPIEDDMHCSGYEASLSRKCSGSAYKLSRNRALHHGTCLINSANLGSISAYLRSPIEPFVKAKGVDSVRSPVTNAFPSDIKDPIGTFVTTVVQAFNSKHKLDLPVLRFSQEAIRVTHLQEFGDNVVQGLLGEDLGEIDQVQEGMAVLKSQSWLWSQTPRFDFSTYPTEEDNRARPQLPHTVPSTAKLHFASRSGQILSGDMSLSPSLQIDNHALIGEDIYKFESWKDVLRLKSISEPQSEDSTRQLSSLASWLDMLFGKE